MLKKIYLKLYWKYRNYKEKTMIQECFLVSRKAKIGKQVMIRRDVFIGDGVEIGEYSYVSGPNSFICSGQIGKFCSIARGVTIGMGNHNYNWVTTHPIMVDKKYNFIEEDIEQPQKNETIIGNDVWIGVNALVMRGIKIGNGAVIAAGSVVTKDVEPYSIVGGNPAKFIKYRFSIETILMLENIRWWDWDKKTIENNIKHFYNVDNFIDL